MARPAWQGVLLAAGMLMWSCSRDTGPGATDNPISPTPTRSPARVLVVTHTEGFRHSSIPVAEATLGALGQNSGLFTAMFCRTADDVAAMLTRSALADVDAIVFANTTGSLPAPDLAALLDWIALGHGFAGMHSASDTYHDAPAYLDMLGNEFLTHGDQTTVEALVENPSHPASSPLGQRFRVFDEIYKFRRPNRGSVTCCCRSIASLPTAWRRRGNPATCHSRGRRPTGRGACSKPRWAIARTSGRTRSISSTFSVAFDGCWGCSVVGPSFSSGVGL